MKEKKNIDRIFQEKFKDFESEPREKVWENIASILDKKEKKRPFIIPLWMKLGGVAAVIAIIIASLLFTQNQETIQNEPGIVFENPENQERKNTETRDQNGASEDKNLENQVASEEADAKTDNGEIITSTSQISSHSSTTSNNQSRKTDSSDTDFNNKSNQETAIASDEVKNNVRVQQQNEEEKVAGKPEAIKDETSGAIAQIETDSTKTIKAIKEEEENALAQLEEEKKNEKKEEAIAETANKKLRLSTFAAPVFYKNMGSGNELSSQFSNNASSSEVTLSYGIKLAYELSDKIRIRTGISKVNMSYNIQDISYSPSGIAANLDNIRPNEDHLQIRSNARPNGGMAFETSNQNSLASSIFTPGEINQQFGFIEVPLEIEYVLVDKKFGLNVIGGGSSLFLDRNRVDLVSGNSTTNLGEASNINNTSFSTNIGLGMDYKLSDKFSISLEPIFKYQLNTFSNVNNVQPMNFGIYSGLNLKF
ncbi:porin family protein [Gramella jeungdoensis]|uniref:Porin family protein n=1 Tax=Gramella jeungdoensis TaxID=708091 RepID=A0ABT0Z2Y2_9FLAO|nr:porin family protein [Gramella jeungdoensis]MCM8569595.1 porin family protein [Gramella jeungdoensis]